MQKNEKIFLLAVAAVALLFCALTLSQTCGLLAQSALESTAPAGPAGTPRTLDLNQIKQMIQQQNLSDHEADFYKKLSEVEKRAPVGTALASAGRPMGSVRSRRPIFNSILLINLSVTRGHPVWWLMYWAYPKWAQPRVLANRRGRNTRRKRMGAVLGIGGGSAEQEDYGVR